jgi:hypothetical protein
VREPLELLDDDRAARQPQRQPRPDVLVEHEDVELRAELAVVAPLGLLELPQVPLERLGVAERHAVDALQHRPPLVAAPVGAGERGQPEVRRQRAGARHVRAAAEVGEARLAALLVEADGTSSGRSSISSTLYGSPSSR